jgi:hypothetical protein
VTPKLETELAAKAMPIAVLDPAGETDMSLIDVAAAAAAEVPDEDDEDSEEDAEDAEDTTASSDDDKVEDAA